ncbi:MAG: DUF3987 domain-containing protein [Deltaproteobacteria bacterium]|nr:DUF3987 domain-containing protein [Deltaproteobacteria bacterium]
MRFHDEVEAGLADGQELAPIRAFANNSAELTARLAALLKMVEDPDADLIGATNMAAGIRLAQFYIGEALRLHHAGATAPDLTEAQKLPDWLHERRERLISLTDIYHCVFPTQLGVRKRPRSWFASLKTTAGWRRWGQPRSEGHNGGRCVPG